jgi:DNA polymerase-3 subunit epsilon
LIIALFDTETTSAKIDRAGIVEIACALFYAIDKPVIPFYCTYSKPMHRCEPEAEKIHGITPEYYRWAPSDVWACWNLLKALKAYGQAVNQEVVLSGYNIDTFDIPLVANVLGVSRPLVESFRSLDVMRLALRRDDGQAYKLVNLFEQECRDHPDYDELVGGAHGAMADCLMSGYVLKKLMVKLGLQNPEDALTFLETPRALRCMPHGKHKGMPFNEIPRSYLQWAAKEWTHMTPDLRLSFQQEGFLRDPT